MAKILVIDDDSMIIDLLKLRLGELGHQVSVAMDAYGAAGAAAREKPDLITLDFQMPAGDGVTAYSRLRGNTFTAKTPVIFVTGTNPGDILARIPNDPLVKVLQKPIDMDELCKLIALLLAPAAPAPSAPRAAAPAPAAAKPPPKKPGLDGGAFGGDILDLDL
jgi:CheY-like chemotaxis protein